MKKHRFLKAFLILLITITLVICSFIFVSGYLPVIQSNKKIDGLEGYAKNIEEIEIPGDAKIIALGEATHGNNELQLIKLEVFQHLVKQHGVRAFCLEADFGEGLLINDYIQNDNGTTEEAVKNLSFEIYHTKAFLDLITWMHDYNLNQSESNKLSFYGFDMQNPEAAVQFLINIIDDENIKQTLSPLTSRNHKSLSDPIIQKAFSLVNEIKDSFEDEVAEHAAYNIMSAYSYYSNYSNAPLEAAVFRDKRMADNVIWILDYERAKGNNSILITAHNGHIAKNHGSLSSSLYYDNMGKLLASQFQDAYFAIGTDYHVSLCSARANEGFKNYKVYSENPLAANAARVSDGYYYLSFQDVKDTNSEVYKILHAHTNVGTFAPSGYNLFYKLYFAIRPSLTRESVIIADTYDAMIVFYKLNPLDFINK